MKENKVEVYKDSNGNFHEKREDYVKAEYSIRHKAIIEFYKNLLAAVTEDPLVHYAHTMNILHRNNGKLTVAVNGYAEHKAFLDEAVKLLVGQGTIPFKKKTTIDDLDYNVFVLNTINQADSNF